MALYNFVGLETSRGFVQFPQECSFSEKHLGHISQLIHQNLKAAEAEFSLVQVSTFFPIFFTLLLRPNFLGPFFANAVLKKS